MVKGAMSSENAVATSGPGWLFDLIQAPLRWQLLETGLREGLFDALETEQSSADVAREKALDAGRLESVLDALTAMGLLHKHRGRFVVAPDMRPFVTSTGDRSVVDMLLTLPRLRHGSVGDLLRQGPDGESPMPDMADAAFWDGSAASLRAFHRGMGADTVLGVLQALPGWTAYRTMLDLGAGSDVLATGIVRNRPEMMVTLCDLPPLAGRFQTRRTAEGGGIGVLAGDYNTLPLGGPYDLILASMTLYYARDLPDVLGRLRAVLRPGGCVVSLHEALTEDGTGPESHVVGRLVPTLRGQSRSFKAGEIAGAMRAAGFDRITGQPVQTPFGLLRVDIGWSRSG